MEQAISYLGLNLLRNLTLVVQIFNVRQVGETHRLQVHRLQRHGLLVGAIARRMVAGQQRLSDDAFMAGILHDIGKLVLIDHEPDRYDLVQRKARLARCPVDEIEREVFGVTHAEIGGYLLGIWGLPYPIVEAVANHHAPERVHKPGVDVLLAVYLANHLALEQERALGVHERVQAPLNESYLAAVGVTDRLEAWRLMAATQIGESRADSWTEGPEGKAA